MFLVLGMFIINKYETVFIDLMELGQVLKALIFGIIPIKISIIFIILPLVANYLLIALYGLSKDIIQHGRYIIILPIYNSLIFSSQAAEYAGLLLQILLRLPQLLSFE